MRRSAVGRTHFKVYNGFNSKDMLRKARLSKNKGFTLIELLVVISIIALLSSIVLASLNTAREKAKIAALVSEVEQFQLALELYKNQTGSYPREGTDNYSFANYGTFYSTTNLGTSFNTYFRSISPPLIPSFIPRFVNFPSELHHHAYITTKKDGLEDTWLRNAPGYQTLCGTTPIQDIGYYLYIYSDYPESISLPFSKINYNGSDSTFEYCVTSP